MIQGIANTYSIFCDATAIIFNRTVLILTILIK